MWILHSLNSPKTTEIYLLIPLQVLMSSTQPVPMSIPAPVPIVNMSMRSSRNFRVSTAAAYSPSLGDDPWLRFM